MGLINYAIQAALIMDLKAITKGNEPECIPLLKPPIMAIVDTIDVEAHDFVKRVNRITMVNPGINSKFLQMNTITAIFRIQSSC